MLAREHMKAAAEAVLFARSEPVTTEEMAVILGVSEEDAGIILEELLEEYNGSIRGIKLGCGQEGYFMCTNPEYHEYVKRANPGPSVKLSQAALETLAIIAYRQPLTRAEIEHIRGVKTERVIASLLSRGLIEEVGKKDAPGRPILYGTTHEFLKLFGLTSLDELPRDLVEIERNDTEQDSKTGNG